MSTTITSQFDMQTRLFNNALEGITEAEADNRPASVNHIKWLAGHLVYTRLMLKDFAGLPADERFDAFDKNMDPGKEYLSLDAIKTKWNEIAEPISNGLKALPEEALNGDGPFMSPIGDKSVRGFLGFISHHEAYHIGQIGILRRAVGKEAMSYN